MAAASGLLVAASGLAPRRRSRVSAARASASDDPPGRASPPPPAVDASKTAAAAHRRAFPPTDVVALAPRPPADALTPLMDRLRAPTRTFRYPALGLALTLAQRWEAAGAGTGAAVWESAERLADALARDGARDALRIHPSAREAPDSTSLPADDDDADPDAARFDAAAARRWWRGKVVVELGAGLGLASLVAAALGARCLATDGDPRAAAMCAKNARANEANLAKAANALSTPFVPPETMRVRWGDARDERATRAWVSAARNAYPRNAAPNAVRNAAPNAVRNAVRDDPHHPDAILLADVVYGSNPEAWSALARTLRRLCGPATAVVLSHTRRAGVGRDAFLRAARREGLEARRATRERRDAGELGSSVTETYVLWLAKG